MVRGTMALALVFFTGAGAWAATPPTDVLRQVFARANQILTDPGTAERPLDRLLAVRKLVNETFDVRSAAELASGDHWRARTLAEQEEFTWLFGDLLERSFVGHMASRASLEGGTRIRYLDESVEGGTALVRTAMARRDGGELLLDYRMIEHSGLWKVHDVAIDGVSVMANYRAQLDRVLGSASFPELLTQMRAKVGTGDPPPRAVAAPVEQTTPTAVAQSSVERVETSPAVSVTATTPLPTPRPTEASLQVRTVSTTDTPSSTVDPRDAAVTASRVTLPAEAPPSRAEPEAPTPAPVVTPPLRALKTRAYWLNIATVETADEAGRVVKRLGEGTRSLVLEWTNLSDAPRLQIRVGPFQDAADAVAALLHLQTKGHAPHLVAERE